MATLEVNNQPPEVADHDAFSADPWLLAAVGRAGIGDIAPARARSDNSWAPRKA
jgi:hypothetical protein